MFKKLFEAITGSNDESLISKAMDNQANAITGNSGQHGQAGGGHGQPEPLDVAAAAAQGQAVVGFAKEDLNDPLQQPLAGILLKDYAAMSQRFTSGVDPEAVYAAIGTTAEAYTAATDIMMDRLKNDTSGQFAQLYGQYFAAGATHPKLQHLTANLSTAGKANLEKIKTDRFFYEEISAAKEAAIAHGLDGNAWVADKFGIPMGEWAAVVTQWMIHQNKNNFEGAKEYGNYHEQKKSEYASKFVSGQV